MQCTSKLKDTRLILLLLAVAPLIAAYIAEYGFNLFPCILCVYQRIPYAVMALLLLLLLLFKKPVSQGILYVLMLVMLCELGIALYHVGVEQKIITQTAGCTDQIDTTSLEALKAELLGKPHAPCDTPEWMFLGLSMASWNVLYAFCLLIVIWRYTKR
jgi:disulfide bond formation protein DsbB